MFFMTSSTPDHHQAGWVLMDGNQADQSWTWAPLELTEHQCHEVMSATSKLFVMVKEVMILLLLLLSTFKPFLTKKEGIWTFSPLPSCSASLSSPRCKRNSIRHLINALRWTPLVWVVEMKMFIQGDHRNRKSYAWSYHLSWSSIANFADIAIFIGPESDHWLCLSLPNWLTAV